MFSYAFLGFIAVIEIGYALYFLLKKQSAKHLWISFYLISIPLAIEKVIGSSDSSAVAPGPLGQYYKITIPLALALLLLFRSKIGEVISFKINNWVTLIGILIIISIFNPYGADSKASIVFAIIFFSHILFYKVMSTIIDGLQLIKGIYHGLFLLCIIQFLLALCFPLLNINAVTTLFHAGGDIEATRLGTRPGAIGLFQHPGALSLFVTMSTSFFVSCLMYNYNKKMSLMMIVVNFFTVILTFSRTSYLAFIILIPILIYVKKNASKDIFSPLNIIKLIAPLALIITYVVFFSPLSETFLNSDADQQVGSRELFYKIAYHIFKNSPVIGVGLNSQVAYLQHHPSIVSDVVKSENSPFYRENPVHNMHLIILAETGAVGFIAWVIFIFKNVFLSVKQLKTYYNNILSLTFVGVIFTYCFYGMTGWSGLSATILPFFLFFAFFTIKSRINIKG